jgi:putative RecB family exonuclease
MIELPPHRSYSQLKTFLACARQYYLAKVARVPEIPAVYLVGGSAVHSQIEAINRIVWAEGLQGVREG